MQSQDKEDGLWWKTLNEHQRLFFVMGFVEAKPDAHGAITGLSKRMQLSKSNTAVLDLLKEDCDYFNLRNGQIYKGVNDFYNDYRNQGIDIQNAISYVRDSIKGKPAAQLEQELTYFRQMATKVRPDVPEAAERSVPHSGTAASIPP